MGGPELLASFIGLGIVGAVAGLVYEYRKGFRARRQRYEPAYAEPELPGQAAAEALLREAVGALDERGGWIDRATGAWVCERLRTIPDEPYFAGLERVGSMHPGGGRAAVLAIKLGRPGSEPALDSVLAARGDSSLAFEYLNSGNEQLADIAADWAARHGYGIIQRTGNSFARWGDTGLDNGGT